MTREGRAAMEGEGGMVVGKVEGEGEGVEEGGRKIWTACRPQRGSRWC